MIRLSGCQKSYRKDSLQIEALAATDVTIHQGDIVMVVGASGAGKSTLLGIAGGLLKPDKGVVWFQEDSLWSMSQKRRAAMRAQQFGFVFQNASVVSCLTLLENVLFASYWVGMSRPQAEARAQQLLDQVGLADRAHAYPDEISGGEKRRVAVVSALMNQPQILLADEPTGELDTETEDKIVDLLLQAHSQGTTLFLVTHNQDLTRYATRVLTMKQGHLREAE